MAAAFKTRIAETQKTTRHPNLFNNTIKLNTPQRCWSAKGGIEKNLAESFFSKAPVQRVTERSTQLYNLSRRIIIALIKSSTRATMPHIGRRWPAPRSGGVRRGLTFL